FRHRLANDRRATKRRLAVGSAAGWAGGGGRVVREGCSGAALRARAGPAGGLPGGSAAGGAGDGERVVREACSEASIRASAGPAAEVPALSPVLERLSRVIDAGITDEERQILRWVSASIPQRLIAEWLGETHKPDAGGGVRV